MKLTRRKFIKQSLAGAAGVLGLSAFGYSYARYIEPHMLTVQAHTIENSKIPRSFHNFKILQFSDTHLGFHYDLDQFESLVQRMNKEEAEIIVFTGDLVDEPQTYGFPPRLIELLQRLDAPLGKYWIYGNHDHGGYGTEKIRSVMEKSGFQLLQNEQVQIENGNEAFTLAGLDDVMLGSPKIEETLAGVPEESFTILMVHEPDVADYYQRYPIDVQLSGHSHGGQVQLPFIGYLVTPPYAEKYVEGHYPLEQDLQLYVSRGIGTTRLPYRFLCRPEISVFQMKTSEER
ncbi:metallophosphoesterase [Halobacillus litoralis]|uniref:metallophosphoesterase n=1 Tax=Halobacillus litoralis TaxID=45668 RepID=UPI001CFD8D15|nr:metallophosphoesterase [Halobacillus litoralis]